MVQGLRALLFRRFRVCIANLLCVCVGVCMSICDYVYACLYRTKTSVMGKAQSVHTSQTSQKFPQ